MATWSKYSDLELLNILKEELDRLGEDSYGRTAFQKNRDVEKVPAPTVYMYRFDAKWNEILAMVGVDYDVKKIQLTKGSEGGKIGGKIGGKVKNKGKWDKVSNDDMLDIIGKDMQSKAMRTKEEYTKKRTKSITPSFSTIRIRFGSWKGLVGELERKGYL